MESNRDKLQATFDHVQSLILGTKSVATHGLPELVSELQSLYFALDGGGR